MSGAQPAHGWGTLTCADCSGPKKHSRSHRCPTCSALERERRPGEKERHSARQIGRRCSSETRALLSIRKKGKKKSIETRLRMSRAQSGSGNNQWRGGKYKNSCGYICVYAPNHPFAIKNHVKEHRLVAEHAIGKYLDKRHEVHHINGIKDDNRPCNLVICEDRAYHQFLHERMKRMKSGAISKEQ